MICKTCKDEGKKSEVYPGMAMTTLMYCRPYYDEEGTYHHHDRNTTTTDYRCSNGHAWTERRRGGICPGCDWSMDGD